MFPISLLRRSHRTTLRGKFIEWLQRYGWAEFWSFSLSIVLTTFFFHLFENRIGSAFFGSLVQTIIFYGVIAYRDIQHGIHRDQRFRVLNVLKVFRNMVLEFGFAEYADSFLIRPFLFAMLPLYFSNYATAIIIGTILADIVYYVPVIIAYELRKKYFG